MKYYSDLPENFNALKNTHVEHLLNHFKALTLIHGNIYEVEMFMQFVLDHTRSRNDNRLFKLLENSFEKTILINLIGLNIPKEEKESAVQYKEEHKNERSGALSMAKNEGKKYLPAATKQSWQLIQYFIEYL